MKNVRLLLCAIVTIFAFVLGNMKVLTEGCTHPNHNTDKDKHYTCIHFVNEYDGKEVRKSCNPEGTGATKTYTHPVKQVENGGDLYVLDGWYDENGNNVSDSSIPAKIRVSFTASSTECADLYYYLKWKVEKAPILEFNYIDNISTGSGSWSNSNGSTAGYTHTFKKPEDQDHFSFLYWAIENTKYNDGDKFSYSFDGKPRNSKEVINAYAWWQPSITLNLYDGDELLSSQEDFESVSIDVEPTKEGYIFDGWVDEEGNKVMEDTFYADPKTKDKVEPTVINLYATWVAEEEEDDTPEVIPDDKPTGKTVPKEAKKTRKVAETVKIMPPDTGI